MLAEEVIEFIQNNGVVPCLAAVLVVPDEGDLKPLASVLECPLLLVR